MDGDVAARDDAVGHSLLVRGLVELDAEEAQVRANTRAHAGGLLADARGEGERVETVERNGHRADGRCDAIREDVEREVPDLAYVAAPAAERFHPGFEV